ncbi:MAG: GDP-mannose 4,6-dehydratase [Oligoflexales bacterium]|nr:GDP-mannose 4,6-dehydratase [Oligoflexales bacterium]
MNHVVEQNSKLQNLRVYVTGATGIVGGFVVEELLKRGAHVIILVRDQVKNSYLETAKLDQRCTIVRGELENFNLQLRIMNEYQINGVIHLAAQTQVRVALEHPLSTLQANIVGTWNILEAIRQCSKYLKFCIIASSDKAYGEALTKQYDESHPLNAVYPYDVSKACADMIASSYAKVYNLPIGITRCGNFFGPGDLNWDRLIPHVVQQYMNNSAPLLRSNGDHVRDYFFVKDGALAYIFLAEKFLESGLTYKGESYNFSYGEQYSVTEVVQTIAKKMGKEHIKAIFENSATNEIIHQSLNSAKARQLGWLPHYSFEEGLEQTISWYQSKLNS